MGKPDNGVFVEFTEKYKRLNTRYGMNQFLVPYLLAAHPGCTVEDSIELAEYLNKSGRQPEQVQLFYPTPGTMSTCMYYTGLDPDTLKPVFVPRTQKEKTIQRAMMQWKRPQNHDIVRQALINADRTDLIGYNKRCLVKPKMKNIKFRNKKD